MRKCLSYILTAVLIFTLTFGFSGYVLATESGEEPAESTVTSVAESESSEETPSEETSSQESSEETSSEEEASSEADDTSSETPDNSDVSSEESSDSQSDESDGESSEEADSSATDDESSDSSEEESLSESSDNEDEDDDDDYYYRPSPSSFVKEYFNDLDESDPSQSQDEVTSSVSKNISDYSQTGRIMMIISVIVALIAVALLIFVNVSAHNRIVAARKRAARKSRLQAKSRAMEERTPEIQEDYYTSDGKFVLQDDFDFGDDFIIGSKDDK